MTTEKRCQLYVHADGVVRAVDGPPPPGAAELDLAGPPGRLIVLESVTGPVSSQPPHCLCRLDLRSIAIAAVSARPIGLAKWFCCRDLHAAEDFARHALARPAGALREERPLLRVVRLPFEGEPFHIPDRDGHFACGAK